MSMLRAERTGPISAASWHWNTAVYPGDAALDRLLEDDVRLVHARLGTPGRVVVDLDGHRRALGNRPAGCRLPGQRAELWRGGSWSSWWSASPWASVVPRRVRAPDRAGGEQDPGKPGGHRHPPPGERPARAGAEMVGVHHDWGTMVEVREPNLVLTCELVRRAQAEAVPAAEAAEAAAPA